MITWRAAAVCCMVGSIGAASNAWGTETCASAPQVSIGLTPFIAGQTFDGPVISCNSNAARDVWFRFVPPLTATYRVQTCNFDPGFFDTVLAVYQGSCNAAAQLVCNDDGGCGTSGWSSIVDVPMTAGTTYLIRVAAWSAPFVGNGQGLLNIQPGEACETALTVGVGTTPIQSGVSTELEAPCRIGSFGDIFYRFTPPQTALYTIETCNTVPNFYDTVLSLYEGTCSGLSLLACNDDAGCGTSGWSSRVQAPLVAGVPYTIRVAAWDFQSRGNGSGQLTIINDGPPAVVNDFCAFATTALEGPNPYNLTGASTDRSVTCNATSSNDVWMRFTAPAAGMYRFSTCTTPQAGAFDTVLSLYETCTGPETACNDDVCGIFGFASSIDRHLSAGQSVLVRIAAYNAGAVNNGQGILFVDALGTSCALPAPLAVSNFFLPFDSNISENESTDCGFGKDLHFVLRPPAPGRYAFEMLCTPLSGRSLYLTSSVEPCEVGPCVDARPQCDARGLARIEVQVEADLSPVYFVVDGNSTEDAGVILVRVSRPTAIEASITPDSAQGGDRALIRAVHTPRLPASGPVAVNLAWGQQLDPMLDNAMLFDDGTNGDQVPGDNIYSREIIVNPSAVRGQYEVTVQAATNFDVLTETSAALLTLGCDSVDFNGDGVFPDDRDITDFFDLLAGAPCAGFCNGVDFNNDGVFPDDADISDFLNVLAGGSCP